MLSYKEYLAEAVSKKKLFSNTDSGRKFRANTHVKSRRSPLASKKGLPKNLERMDYIVKSRPSTEQKTHHGYVDYNLKNNKIHRMFCDCKDYFYRLYAPLVQEDLATWDIDEKYKKRMHLNHNKKWTNETNVDGKIYVCKHLYYVLDRYIPE